MHVDHNVEEFKPPFTEETLRGHGDGSNELALTPTHIGALSICLTSIDGIFETFLRFNVDTIRCLPVANFVRVAYATVVLIKMYFASATPNSELGKVIDKDNMKVEQYLDGLVDLFRAAASDEKSRPSAKFLMVLLMLKTWFHRQREGKPQAMNEAGAANEVAAVEVPDLKQKSKQPRNGAQAGYSPANTPLQLLSEVATGNSGGQSRSGSISQYQGGSNDWNQQQMNFGNYPMNQSNMGQYGNIPPNIDPSLGGMAMDLSYSMGDNFEQAMGMTFGVGDFGGFYGDDGFFGGMIDPSTTGMFEGY